MLSPSTRQSPHLNRERLRTSLATRVLLVLVSALLSTSALATRYAASQTEGVTIAGVIQDDRGDPVSDAKVTLTSIAISTSVLTHADGRFEFKNLKPAQYQIVAEAVRFRKEKTTLIVARADEVINPITIRLSPSSLHVTVLDSNNQPLGGVSLAVHLRERAGAGEVQAERRTTDESGDAYFGRLSPGSYHLTATLRGYDEYRNDVFISAGITTEFPVQLLVAPVIPINEKALVRYALPGLPSKNILSLFQDSDGWMWFGTDKGAARFNGTDFQTSALLPGSVFDQLAGEEIRSIVEDHSGLIWIATAQFIKRVSREGREAAPTLAVSDAHQVLVDSKGEIWILSGNGLARMVGAELKTISIEDSRAATEDRSGRIWVATTNGLKLVEHDSLVLADIAASGVDTATRDAALLNVRQLYVDRSGIIWLATARGAFTLVPSSGGAASGTLTAAAPLTHSAAISGGVRSICEDSRGRLCLALEAGGVLLFDSDRNDSQRISSLLRDHISVTLASREGQVWFGGDNGAVQSDLYRFVVFTASRGLLDNEINAVFEMPAALAGNVSRLWFFSSTGISRMDGERFAPVEGFRSNINVQAAALDASGNAWFATEQGALRLTGKTLTQFNESTGLASNNVRWVSSIAHGLAVAFATSRGASIFKDGQMRVVSPLAGYDCRHVFEDLDGSLWFSTSRGAVRYDPATEQSELVDVERGLADDDVRWIARFGDRFLIATHGGVQSYNSAHDRLAFSSFDGDPTSAMFVDNDGYLWTGTDEGQVKKFAQAGGQVISTVYSGESNALFGGQINSFSEDGEGNIWIATNRGAVRHVPLRVAPQAQIAVDIDGRGFQPHSEVEVPYGRHRFTFRFTAISLSGQTRYLYRVNTDAGSAAWKALTSVQPSEREVSLLDLDEGVHSFEVMALNRDLYGSNQPAATVSLHVGLPFWKRWWFYAIAALAVALGVTAALAGRQSRNREYVLPKELRSFVPIEPNPYIVGNPIRTEAMFYGRQDDFRYVRTKLEGVNQGVVIVFCGERRVGKSSILYQVLNGRLGERFIPVFVDLQEMVVSSDAELFARISRLISESVTRAAARSAVTAGAGSSSPIAVAIQSPIDSDARPALNVPQFDGRNPYPVFLDFLDEVLRTIEDKTLLILMDEYELLEGKVDEGKLSTEFFTFLAGLMDNRERLALIFTGSRRLEERDRKYWRELLRRSLFRKVGFLSLNDTARLITEPVAGRVVYGRGVTDEIVRLTAGQPFYVQVICQNIVDYMNENRQNWVTVADLQKVIGEVVDNPLPQMIYTWDALSDDEKLILSLLGEALADGFGYASARALRASVRENDYPVNLSETTIRLTLEEMFRRELLEKDTAEGFRFKIDLLRLWIKRSHSIWQVVKEVRTL